METQTSNAHGEEQVSLSTLAEITGFPVDYIKSELLLNKDALSLDELRSLIVKYLVSDQQFVQA